MSFNRIQFFNSDVFRRAALICLAFLIAMTARLPSLLVVPAVFLAPTALAQDDADSDGNYQVSKLRVWNSEDATRLVFDVSGDVRHKLFKLKDPDRLVLDLENTELAATLPSIDAANQHMKAVRTGRPNPNVLRFVLELKKPLQATNFALTPNELYGYRIVVDLTNHGAEPLASTAGIAHAPVPAKSVLTKAAELPAPEIDQSDTVSQSDRTVPTLPAVLTPINLPPPAQGKIVVAIDAGHGGVDPGAIGHRGSREKVITLQIAKRLKKVIDSDQRMRAVLVREGDYFIDLHKRRQMASAKGADIFVSIHADAFKRRSAHGLSVFALSQSGATSAMARALAAKENASDLIGGVSLADKDEVLKKVLVDLSMTNTISESVNLGGRVLSELAKVGKLHSKRVEQAGFAVLKSPDIPSILVETGFITNPEEERKLKTSAYQDKLVNAIYRALSEYYDQTPYYTIASYSSPRLAGATPSAPASPKFHKVVRGDTLSEIAQKYGTSLRELKRVNKLRSNTAKLGQRLKLPAGARSASGPTGNSSKPSVHVVKRGDSLSKISAQYNVTLRALKRLNNLTSNTVVPGQKIKLVAGGTVNSQTSAPSKPVTHKVRRGDTLSEIAEKYGSTIRKIMRANNMRSRTVMLGQTLKIPG